ncbi:MAG: NAD-binding protein [Anaerolineales bacterium]
MNFIVIGCGRVGSELAFRLYKNGHKVTVVDSRREAFEALDPAFRGRTLEGDALTEGVLERAGIASADGLASVTNSDTRNAVTAHIARAIYKVPIVVVRNYDPAMRPMMEVFDLQLVSSPSWGAQRIQELLIDPAFRTVFSAGNGEVEVYEMRIPADWNKRPLTDLMRKAPGCLPVALTRAGRALLPTPEIVLLEGDLLNVSATFEGIQALHACLDNRQEA